jgi:crossover junction endonuclease EME1
VVQAVAMPEVISLLSSSPAAVLPRASPVKQRNASLGPLANIFDSDDFDASGDLEFPTQPAKRRKPSPPSQHQPASTRFVEAELSSDDELPASSAPVTTARTLPFIFDDLDDRDNIEFSSSAPQLVTKVGPSSKEVLVLSSDSEGDDRYAQAVGAPKHLFSAEVWKILNSSTSTQRPAARKPLQPANIRTKESITDSMALKPRSGLTASQGQPDDIVFTSQPEPSSIKARKAPKTSDTDRQAAKAAREAAKEAEKARKREARLEQEQTRQKAKDLAEVNKSKANKKETSKEMIVRMDGVLEGTSVGNQVEEYMRQHDIKFSYATEEIDLSRTGPPPLGKLIRWQRKLEATFDDDEGQWMPLSRARIEAVDHVAILLNGLEFATIALGASATDEALEAPTLDVMKENLDHYVGNLRARHKDCRLILLAQGLYAWVKKNDNTRNREYTAAVRAQIAGETEGSLPAPSQARKRKRAQTPRHIFAITADVIEDIQLHLQVNHQPVVIHHTTSDAATASQILSFTQNLSVRPYKMVELEQNLKSASFYMGSGFKGGDNAEDTFGQMLGQLQRVTPSIAQSIVSQWNSPRDLVVAFREHGSAMLEDVRKSTNRDGGYSDKRIGKVISSRMHKVFMGRNPDSTHGMS